MYLNNNNFFKNKYAQYLLKRKLEIKKIIYIY